MLLPKNARVPSGHGGRGWVILGASERVRPGPARRACGAWLLWRAAGALPQDWPHYLHRRQLTRGIARQRGLLCRIGSTSPVSGLTFARPGVYLIEALADGVAFARRELRVIAKQPAAASLAALAASAW